MRIKHLKIFLLFVISCWTINLLAAVPGGQQNPPNMHWKNITTEHFRVIFPEKIEDEAQRVANLLEYYSAYNSKTLKVKRKRIDVVLANQYAVANAFVSFAPFYSCFYSTPSTFGGVEWYNLLAIHEGRHMIQQYKLSQGLGKNFWYVGAGEIGRATFSILYIPNWLAEGDAVSMETALTNGGRGRSANFFLWTRTLELSNIHYSYDRMYLGSYRRDLPYYNYYRLGYLLTVYVRKHYGALAWDRIVSNTGKYSFFPTFNSAVKKETGLNIRQLYEKAMAEYKQIWLAQEKDLKFTNAQIVGPQTKKWQSWLYPVKINSKEYLALRLQPDKRITLYKVKENGEQVKVKQVPSFLASAAVNNNRQFSVANNKVLWLGQKPDLRFGLRSWREIRLLDLTTKKEKVIFPKNRLTSASLSADAKQIVAVEFNEKRKCHVLFLDVATEKEILRLVAPNNSFLAEPVFSADQKYCAFISTSLKGQGLVLLDLKNKKFQYLIAESGQENLRSPIFYQGYLFYSSDYSGIDNIYAYDLKTQKKWQVTSRRFGAFFPAIDEQNKELIFNDYSAKGYKIAKVKIEPQKWISLNKIKPKYFAGAELLARQEVGKNIAKEELIPTKEHEVKKYSFPRRSFRPYAWLFSYDQNYNLGLEFLSSNILRDVDLSLMYVFNTSQLTHAGQFKVSYKRFFPIIDFSVLYGSRSAFYLQKFALPPKGYYNNWNEFKTGLKVTLPFNLSRGLDTTHFNLFVESNYLHLDNVELKGDNALQKVLERSYNPFTYGFAFSHQREDHASVVKNRFSQSLKVSYSHIPFYRKKRGDLLSVAGYLSLPGFWRTHVIYLDLGFENRNQDDYLFAQKIVFSRGYKQQVHSQLYSARFNYALPLVDFEWNLGRSLYFRRIILNGFFDATYGYTKPKLTAYKSVGAELSFEINLLSNQYYIFEIGGGYAYALDAHKHTGHFVFNFKY